METTAARHVTKGSGKRIVALALVVLLLSGCATQGAQARAEGTAAGAGIGAVIGAAIGAALGGAGGYVYADRIAKRHAALAGKEQDLDAQVAFARGINEDTEQYNRRLQKEVADLEPKIANLEARTKRQQVTQGELTKQRQALGTKVDDANKQLALAEDQLQGLKKFRDERPNASRDLDEQIRTLEAHLAQMRSNTTALASLNQRI